MIYSLKMCSTQILKVSAYCHFAYAPAEQSRVCLHETITHRGKLCASHTELTKADNGSADQGGQFNQTPCNAFKGTAHTAETAT